MGKLYDPIEAAKMQKPQPKPTLVVVAPEPKPEPLPVVEAAPPAPELLKRYRVTEAKAVSVNGMLTWVSPGQLIDAAGHGTEGVRRLIEQGVKLEEI